MRLSELFSCQLNWNIKLKCIAYMSEVLYGRNKGTCFSFIWLIPIYPSEPDSVITFFKKLSVILHCIHQHHHPSLLAPTSLLLPPHTAATTTTTTAAQSTQVTLCMPLTGQYYTMFTAVLSLDLFLWCQRLLLILSPQCLIKFLPCSRYSINVC